MLRIADSRGGDDRVIETTGIAIGPSWSPDGEHLAFVELAQAGGGLKVHILRREDWSESVATVDQADRVAQIAWSPGSRLLALVGLTTTLLDADAAVVARAAVPIAAEAFAAAGARWSPDGARLAAGIGQRLWLIERDGSVSELTGAPGGAGYLGVAEWLSDLELLTIRLTALGPPLSATLAPGRTIWRELAEAELEEELALLFPDPEQTDALDALFPDSDGTVLGPTADGEGRTYEVRERGACASVIVVFASRSTTDLLAEFEADTQLAGSIGPASSVVVVR